MRRLYAGLCLLLYALIAPAAASAQTEYPFPKPAAIGPNAAPAGGTAPAPALSIESLVHTLGAAAKPPTGSIALHFPIDCKTGQTCWVLDFTSAASAPLRANCAWHDGLDVALPDQVTMEMGAKILSPGPGTISRIRDGMDDAESDAATFADLIKTGKGCGNGVLIDHGSGWQTMLCHLKKDTIAVRPGQRVKTGDIIAQAGMSGAAFFPHLHLSLTHQGRLIDPYTGLENNAASCALPLSKKTGTRVQNPVRNALQHPGINLWADTPPVPEQVALYAAGFSAGIPDFTVLKIDTTAPKSIDLHAPVLAFWAGFYDVRAGDRIRMAILSPDHKPIIIRDIVQDKDQPRQFYFIGRPSGSRNMRGVYKAIATLTRRVTASPPLKRSIERTVIMR